MRSRRAQKAVSGTPVPGSDFLVDEVVEHLGDAQAADQHALCHCFLVPRLLRDHTFLDQVVDLSRGITRRERLANAVPEGRRLCIWRRQLHGQPSVCTLPAMLYHRSAPARSIGSAR